jgi:predicted PurR-regulated permease PerM
MGYMMLFFIIVQIIDNVLFQPLIFGKSVKAHPLEVFLVILITATLFGPFAMIIAIPAYTVIRVFGKEFFYRYKLVKKLTEHID